MINDPFKIIDEDNNNISYIGRMVKHGKFTISDFVEIYPNKSYSNQIDLSDGYELITGKSYIIQFDKYVIFITESYNEVYF